MQARRWKSTPRSPSSRNTLTISAKSPSSVISHSWEFLYLAHHLKFSLPTELSFMERMIETGVPYTMLNTQYRTHPDIAKMVSALFYNNELLNNQPVVLRWSAGNYSVIHSWIRNLASRSSKLSKLKWQSSSDSHSRITHEVSLRRLLPYCTKSFQLFTTGWRMRKRLHKSKTATKRAQVLRQKRGKENVVASWWRGFTSWLTLYFRPSVSTWRSRSRT